MKNDEHAYDFFDFAAMNGHYWEDNPIDYSKLPLDAPSLSGKRPTGLDYMYYPDLAATQEE